MKTVAEDFTEEHYRQVLAMAKRSYVPVSYTNIPYGGKFVLWRHDVDVSLNRALALATIEEEEGVLATYFILLRSPFYSPYETEQRELILQILDKGHELGLHFDANAYGSLEKSTLEDAISTEAQILERLVGCAPVAVSFHNPTEEHLRWNDDQYSGLRNCYSSLLFHDTSYVSDSNGYWRFRRLYDVLEQAQDDSLQVLTHPECWQQQPMAQRRRIHRSVYGRAAAAMVNYDLLLERSNRINLNGMPDSFGKLRNAMGSNFLLLDYLWNEGHIESLFLELWRLHELQLNELCRAKFMKQWCVPADEVNSLFAPYGVSPNGWRLFEVAFGQPWAAAIGIESMEHRKWVEVRNQLIHGREAFPPMELQRGCSYLATIVTALASWGLQQPFRYDGLAPLGSIGLPTVATAEGSLIEELDEGVASNGRGISPRRLIEWEQLKARLVDGQTAPSQP